MDPEAALDELWRKVDAFHERVEGRYPGALACAAGCSECCHRELTVTAIEARRIATAIAELAQGAPEEVEAIIDRARRGEACVALDQEGRCAVYWARPLVCRSHGLPLRFVEPGSPSAPDGKRALPVLDVCPKNFVDRDLASIDPDCVLDQTTLSVLLGRIDALASAGTPDPRIALRDLILAMVDDGSDDEDRPADPEGGAA